MGSGPQKKRKKPGTLAIFLFKKEIFCPAKVIPKTPPLGVFGLFWGPPGANPRPVDCSSPNNPKSKNLSCFESFDPIFFRLLKHPRRLGLGQKVPGKHPFGPLEPRFMSPKNTGPRKDQNGPKMAFLQEPRFRHKTGKTGQFLYCRVYLVSQKHNKDNGKG